jgi:predicted ATPase/DNA-binding winged helix-turn-helix (wHTH) protein
VRQAKVSGRFSFEGYELDAIERVLRHGAQTVRLSARQFDLLSALVQSRGAVVTKDELLSQVWPGLAVEENNVAVHVSGLRRVLGRASIETVTGQGYRFAWRVGVELPSSANEGSVTAAPPALPQRDLPTLSGVLHGRATELQALDGHLSVARLVTMVGSPGVGKSMLAMALAHHRRQALNDGVVWVGLGRDDAPLSVLASVAMALGLDAQVPLSAVLAALRRIEALLVIDNAEVDADEVAAFVHAALESTERLSVLVTSRRVLRVSGEQVFRVSPLSLPPPGSRGAAALSSGAVALFVEQARAQGQHIELDAQNVAAVAELCRRLDGLPLAIQLAAGRLKVFSLAQLIERLHDRFRLLTRAGAAGPRRHRSLRASIDLSHALLSPVERQVFLKLAQFDGSFTLDEAITVLASNRLEAWDVADALEGLVDHSLVLVEPEPTPRYRLLDSIRAYAEGVMDLAAGACSTARRHAHAVRTLFDSAVRMQQMKAEAPYLAQFAPDIDQLRAALDNCLIDDARAAGELMVFSRALCELLSLTCGPRSVRTTWGPGSSLPFALPAPR